LAPVGAYLAVAGQFNWLPIAFGLIVLTWVSGFDIIYALQDEEFDRSQDLYSVPAVWGKKKGLGRFGGGACFEWYFGCNSGHALGYRHLVLGRVQAALPACSFISTCW
jgi:hypothetical protein